MTIFLVTVYAIHFIPSNWFAEAEFVIAALKGIEIVVILLVALP